MTDQTPERTDGVDEPQPLTPEELSGFKKSLGEFGGNISFTRDFADRFAATIDAAHSQIAELQRRERDWRANEMDRTPIVGWVWCGRAAECLPVDGDHEWGTCTGTHHSLYTGTWTYPRLIAAEAENAKLRGVVKDLLTEAQRVYPHCPHRNYSEDGECPLCAATSRARAALDHLEES